MLSRQQKNKNDRIFKDNIVKKITKYVFEK